MKFSTLLHLHLMIAAAVPATTFLPSEAQAATVTLNGTDAAGTTSFNAAGHWDNLQAPSAANDYYTSTFAMRTPTDATTPITFAGASLTLGPATDPTGTGSVIEKFTLGANSVRTITINNFTNSTNARIRSGNSGGAIIHIAGNHYTIAGNSAIWADQCIWVIDSPLIGGDSVILTNYANNGNGAVNHTTYTANNSLFTGSWYLIVNAGTTDWSAETDSVNSPPGNPSTFNPGQITFLTGGQLRDTAGCSFTNSNGGFMLAANGNINTSTTTLIGEPITDFTNGVSSVKSLTSSGTGTLILSNANNNYSGGTIISAGTVQLGAANSVPVGPLTVNGTFDLNTYSDAINGLTGSGTVETLAGGTPTLTIGAAGGSATFSGTIVENSVGTLSVLKTGAGTQTFSAGYGYKGTTTVAGGTLSLVTSVAVPASPGDMVVSNASLTVDATSGVTLPAQNFVVTNATLNLSLIPTANGISATGLNFLANSTNNFSYGVLTANPVAPAIQVNSGNIAGVATVVINISAVGLRAGQFPLFTYTGPGQGIAGPFASPLFLPPGVVGTLVNNPSANSIDLLISSAPNNLSWFGVGSANWDTTTVNWSNASTATLTSFQQYGGVAGDGVVFDDTLTNGAAGPTNINMTAPFYAFPVVVNSTLPYSLSGPGGILGSTSLVKSNSGSFTVLSSNAYTGGTFVYGGTLVVSNDTAFGTNTGVVQLNGGGLQYIGSTTNNVRPFSLPILSTIAVSANNTVQLGGAITGPGGLQKQDLGTLVLAGQTRLTGPTTGNLFENSGVITIPAGGSVSNAYFADIGVNGTDNATLNITGGSLASPADFNIGNDDAAVGTLNISSGTLTVNALFVASGFTAGSTASGTVNQSGGTVTELSATAGSFAIGGRNSTAAVGVYNLNGGIVNANVALRVGGAGTGTMNQNGGIINAVLGMNIARLAGSVGTNNLNGGTNNTFNVTSTTGVNAIFNFNGGTLKAAFTNGTPFMSGLSQANILAGGAIIDDGGGAALITQPLLAGSPNGGLTKQGSGTLTLSGVNTFTGPITNNAGTLFLNSASTYSGAVQVKAGTLQMTTASQLQGGATVAANATLGIVQSGSATATLGNLTFNGQATLPGAALALALTSANNANVPFVNAGTLTLNGTNTISLAGAAKVGATALIKYTGAIVGSGNITNLLLPQGVVGSISNDVADSILYAVITSAGSGIVWTGTNSSPALTNLWDINSSTNWLLNTTATRYQQVVVPGDAVTFNDVGSGAVILNTNVGPGNVTISNNAKTYTFSGRGTIGGPGGLLKLGTGTAIINLTNDSYVGATTISNGTLQVGSASAISPAANAVIGPSGTLALNGFSQTMGDLTGSGLVDNATGTILALTVGSSGGGRWDGTIKDHGGDTIQLTKNGSGTWVLGGTNDLNSGNAFNVQNQFNGGTTVITNNGVVSSPFLQMYVGNGAGVTSSVVVAGGTLTVSNRIVVGLGGASGTLTINSGTITHGGPVLNVGGDPNNIYVGGATAQAGASVGTGMFIVNGGQVLNTREIKVGGSAGSTGTFILNGGLVQALDVFSDAGATSTTIFNGGALQAVAASADFIRTSSLVMSNGLVLDDGGYVVSLETGVLTPGDAFNGGVVKQGAGTVYFDSAHSYTGATVVTNGTLGGIGSIAGPLVVGPAGNVAPGDAGSTAGGIFTIGGNLTLQGTATFRISVTGSSPANDQLTGITTANYGGTLVVNNVTSDATVLTNGQAFQLFSAASGFGNFANIVGSPGAGLSYVFHPSIGVLSVTNAVAKSAPFFTHLSVLGTTLNISGTNGTPAGNYVLLGTTNVALPVAQWTPLLTNTFDGSGNFNLSTNIVNPAVPAQFYILSQ